MVFTTLRNLVLAIIFAGLLGFPHGESKALQTAAVDLVSPNVCPSGGCAAGQRLNFKIDFSVDKLDNAVTQPDLLVCMYAPQEWSATQFEFTPTGTVSGKKYVSDSNHCGSSEGLLGGALSDFTLPSTTFGDLLPFSLRIGKSALEGGSITVRVFELGTGNNWSKVSEVSRAIPLTATSAQVYVANDAASCAGHSPCYLNSLDDKSDGLGTGLKDAIDAAPAPAVITILGDYTVKQNNILVDQAHTIRGTGTSGITVSGAACDQAVLKISASATIRGLAIDDGGCSNPNRDLIWVTDPNTGTINIESNNLTGGEDAIHIVGNNKANVDLRFSHITGNSAYAIYMDSANTGVLDASANNLYGNRSGVQVECNGSTSTIKGKVDHNFWGAGVTASQGVSQCSVDNTKRLGAAILRNTGIPGVQAQAVTAQTTSQYVYNNGIGFQRSGAGVDFNLVIANHGQGTTDNIPFTPGQIGNPFVCGNFYDVFLADTTTPTSGAILNLFFRYDLNSTCINTIESAQYCGQTSNLAALPLWWYDPAQSAWKTTGSPGGQPTACDIDRNEVHVTVQIGGRPDFTDLARLPMVAGLPSQPTAIVFSSSLTAQPGNTQATVLWTTSSEINIGGYIVQRSTQADTGFTDITNLPRQGSGTGGASYDFTDTGLTNNTLYYYRLRIVGLDGNFINSDVVSVTPIPPTATPTPTRTITPTVTLTKIPTSTLTYFPTSTRTRTPTPSPTSSPSPTSPLQTITNTPAPSATGLTQAATSSAYPPPSGSVAPVAKTIDPGTALAETRAARTQIVKLSQTPTPTTTPEPTAAGGGSLTILMAVLAVGALAGGAMYLIREQQSAH